MFYLTESDVVSLLPMRACIDQMRLAFAALRDGAAINQPRRRLILKTGSVLHQMAGSWGKYFCTKVYSSNVRHGGLHQMYVFLYDAETGKPLALLEAIQHGLIRTGAASGYVTGLLARPDAEILGVIGSGAQARTQVEAVRAVRPVPLVRVWSRNPERAQRFAKEMDCTAVESAEAAVRGAHIVVTATTAKEPVLEASWVSPGALVLAMGSNMANRRELPADLVRSAASIVVDNLEQARLEAGDLLMADHWDNVQELKDAVARYDAQGITIFESLGIAVEDAAAAAYVYERALASGVGRPMS